MISARLAPVLLVASVSMLPGVARAQALSPARAGGVPAVVFKAGVDVVTLTAAAAGPPGGERAILAVDGAQSDVGTLADLSRWTGGDMKVASLPEHAVEALGTLFAELRYQYLITFESGAAPGWHPLEVRTRNNTLTVHARSGYISGPSPSDR